MNEAERKKRVRQHAEQRIMEAITRNDAAVRILRTEEIRLDVLEPLERASDALLEALGMIEEGDAP